MPRRLIWSLITAITTSPLRAGRIDVGLEVDSEGLIFPVKVQGLANKRIDGAVALIICYIMYQWNRTEYLQIIR
jgi:hypothetical protein